MKNDELVELETKIAYQEDTIQTLNDALCKQQQKIDKLEAKMNHMLQKIREFEEPALAENSNEEIPPHY
jgi:SlyX protein